MRVVLNIEENGYSTHIHIIHKEVIFCVVDELSFEMDQQTLCELRPLLSLRAENERAR